MSSVDQDDEDAPSTIAASAETDDDDALVRFAMILAYDGEPFHGSAADPQQPDTVQAHVQRRLASITMVPSSCQATHATFHGRTDAGVHSRGTVVHVDLTRDQVRRLVTLRQRQVTSSSSSQRDTETTTPATQAAAAAAMLERSLIRGLGSGHLRYIQIRRVYAVHRSLFHARKSSVGKLYSYRLHTGDAPLPWETRRAWCLHRPLDVTAMRRVASHTLVGVRDCTVLCRDRRRRPDDRSPVRRIVDVRISPSCDDDDVTVIYVHADFFLTNMCRRLVGLLVQVGLGRVTPQRVHDALGTGFFRHPPQRDLFLVTAPPQGLCLERVYYHAHGRGGDPTRPARR